MAAAPDPAGLESRRSVWTASTCTGHGGRCASPVARAEIGGAAIAGPGGAEPRRSSRAATPSGRSLAVSPAGAERMARRCTCAAIAHSVPRRPRSKRDRRNRSRPDRLGIVRTGSSSPPRTARFAPITSAWSSQLSSHWSSSTNSTSTLLVRSSRCGCPAESTVKASPSTDLRGEVRSLLIPSAAVISIGTGRQPRGRRRRRRGEAPVGLDSPTPRSGRSNSAKLSSP